jgi:hypothetical protein
MADGGDGGASASDDTGLDCSPASTTLNLRPVRAGVDDEQVAVQ